MAKRILTIAGENRVAIHTRTSPTLHHAVVS